MDGRDETMFYHAAALACRGNYRELQRIHAQHRSWRNVWEKLSAENRRGIEPSRALKELRDSGIWLALRGESSYPARLLEIPWPPFGIYGMGETACFKLPAVAIVGTRKATVEGKSIARRFGATLGRAGVAVVSGLAIGIDASSHEGCLDSAGTTIAVLGNGLDRFYPRLNEGLAKRIIQAGGALISEYAPGAPPLPHRFIERNRIVSGISLGVLLVEVPAISGARSTARFALEQNRDIFVVPGPALHPNYRGSHDLIRNGAELVTAPEHVLEALRLTQKQEEAREPKTEAEEIILAFLRGAREPQDIDKIIEHSKLKTQTTSQAITMLLLKDLIHEDEQGYSAR